MSLTGRPVVEVEGLVKRYRKASVNAVDGISFSVESGAFFALLGPNGAGKTTTISVLTTTLAPTRGHLRIGGFDVTASPAAVRRQVGIIFQNPSLDGNLTGEENVRLHAILYGLYPYRPRFTLMPAAYRGQIADLAAMLNIEEEIFRPIRTLSGGTRRKLEIVRSLTHHPRVLFLDEPTRGLDAASRRDLWRHLRSVQDTGTTVFLTTHYLEEAEAADAVCIINKGRVVAQGSPSQLKAQLTTEALVADALDRPRLREELTARGIPFTQTPAFRIPLNGRTAQEVIRAIETPLNLLRIEAPTLEEAYLAIVERE
ncbi:MAG: ABC transporter ATP-binding protein [Chloroflexi bacterium]|nr:MAG: ABC transporter ATP-binding protein [Chloroflexota bacterium]